MNLKTVFAALIAAACIALVAYLIELSTHLPEPVAYFAIALLAATLTLLLTSRSPGKSRHRKKASTRSSATSASSNASKERGSVKWFSASKGFGFITRDNGEDVFVHFRSINGNGHRVLREGQRVEFAVTVGDKGLQAEEVEALKS